MAKKCKSCGAPLDFSGDLEEIKCNYCGTLNSIQRINLGKIIAAFFNQKPTVVQKKQKKTPLILSLILGIGIPVVFVLSQFTTIFGNLNWISDCQFIDYNHDGVLDIVGYTKVPARWEILTIVDGNNGKLLEKKDIQETGIAKKIYCVNQEYIITTSSDNLLVLYEPKNLTEKYVLDLPGVLMGFDMQNDTLFLKLADSGGEIILGVDINTGEEFECTTKKDLKFPEIGNYDDYYLNKGTNIEYQVNYSYKTKTMVSASKQDKVLWSKKLKDIKLDEQKSFHFTPDHIIIFGEKSGDDENTYIIGLDKNSGEILYEVKQKSGTSILLNSYYNQKYLITYWNESLEAYDPATGEMVWDF